VPQEGYTALMEAAFYDHLAVVQALLEAGADINIKNDVGVRNFVARDCAIRKTSLENEKDCLFLMSSFFVF